MNLRIFLLMACILCIHPIETNEIPLEGLFDREGVRVVWDPHRNVLVVEEGERSITIKPELPWAIGNGERIIPSSVRRDENGELLLSEPTATRFLSYLGAQPEGGVNVVAVVIDPGHGGRDPGAVGSSTGADGAIVKYYEKDITLKLASLLEELFVRDYPDKEIILTRRTDRYLTLEQRTDVANRVELSHNDAMIFLSLHVNASFNKSAQGFEVWYLPPEYRRDLLTTEDAKSLQVNLRPIINTMKEEVFTLESIFLAETISNRMEELVGNQTPNRGLKEESWFVVRNAKMPSVLVEIGFISNEDEATMLGSPSYLNQIALGIYNGVREYITKYENTKGFTEADG